MIILGIETSCDETGVGIVRDGREVLANMLIDHSPAFPLLSLSVSGGHSHLIWFDGPLSYKLLGVTRDDAAGEAFDKVAKMMGLSYPGGPAVGKAAETGNEHAFALPK